MAGNTDAIARRLRELLAAHSGAALGSLSDRSTPQNTEGWDSVANLLLMEAIEEEFAVTIATRDVLKLRSLGDIATYLETHAQSQARTPGSSRTVG